MGRLKDFFKSRVGILIVACLMVDGILLSVSPRGTLDQKFHYTGEEGRRALEAFSTTEYRAYLLTAWIDLLFIGLYTALLFSLLQKLTRQLRSRRELHWLAFLPGGFDFVETLSILGILQGVFSVEILDWLGNVTAGKWISVLLTIAALAHLQSRGMRRGPGPDRTGTSS